MPDRSLAEKLDALFRARGDTSLEDVARAIRQTGGPTISASYLWLLRTGKKDNPTLRHVEALARYFGVPPAYFFADDLTEAVTGDAEGPVAGRAPAGRAGCGALGAVAPGAGRARRRPRRGGGGHGPSEAAAWSATGEEAKKVVIFYHRTTPDAAAAILAGGFRDATGYYMTSSLHTGVWLSDVPLDENEGTATGPLLEVRVDDPAQFAPYEWVQGIGYREWLVPAAILNACGRVRLLPDDEEDDG